MARLILLNGPPAAGKSTLARMYVAEHPLALDLDVDLVRRQLGGWDGQPEASGRLARGIALAAAQAHLLAGHDVVVPQLLARVDFIVALESLAARVGADFDEVVLLAGRQTLRRRLDARTRAAAHPSHVEAQRMLDQGRPGESLEELQDRLLELLESRPTAVRIDVEGEPVCAYQRLLAALRWPPGTH